MRKGTHPGCYAYKPCPSCGACNCRYQESTLCVCHHCFAYLFQEPGGREFLLVTEADLTLMDEDIQKQWRGARKFVQDFSAQLDKVAKPPPF